MTDRINEYVNVCEATEEIVALYYCLLFCQRMFISLT
jgi:hypothetical protein